MTRGSGIRRGGFTLLLTVALIGAIGLTLGLLLQYFVGLTQSVKCITLDVLAAQLLADGQAWAATHREDCAALVPGKSIELPVDDLVPSALAATLRIAIDETAGPAARTAERGSDVAAQHVLITATVRQEKYVAIVRTSFPILPAAARRQGQGQPDPRRGGPGGGAGGVGAIAGAEPGGGEERVATQTGQ
jgi:hypothetical protein